MKRLYKITCFFAISMLLISGCIKRPEYADTPEISFLSFQTLKDVNGKDVSGLLTIEFTDGDGNIGLSQNDTLAPYHVSGDHYYNFYSTFFQKKNNVFVAIPVPYNARIPRISESEVDKDIKGEIQIEIDLTFLPLVLQSDTIRFDLQIEDRDFNKSNIVTTPEFVLSL